MSGALVAARGDVPEVDAEADDPNRPRVNFGECSVELHEDVRPPEPVGPGRPARIDYAYERNGTADLFVAVDPHAGRRYVTVTERRTRADFARRMKAPCDDLYPDADRVRAVPDDPDAHAAGALYEAFDPAGARRLAAELEFHDTPGHAGRLNMAERELSVPARRCSSRRLPDAATPAAEVAAWQAARNRDRVKIEWCLKVADARKKMARVYPQQTPAADH